ncbi:Phosphoenolpyruvate-dihydroxyacetone phosphotransferase, subunit DhaM; DHA-specific IIA component / DHA-specific phosphocarrier protein HPr / DHA-specific EI component [Rhodovastum atsumiense]|uniref:Phosphoenolpyruvate--protein phosphotransferase n=1 Tax=Rhodovastum atsumiense TaxID=504468 RepID=A0A5M6IPL7_9PROT|nr:phosphoenolpyruvate--protein phosphotransferase [Rhodovastum atsumiense]KAA5609508.1 phosphoenolpyruvate--protein phosphotransferase [Rhodovastum atsumiense]CAH2600789.1 Phosphoenolpyruvate-dihydroxyacetone phosphotransferase, subunit DhaM; DHA-specific IIA component / DHA-specific phosphocarrier protein HPr / DHA-specific EI component [Rhodovastum atsumiense]
MPAQVGLLLVSHSRPLGEAVEVLARQMVGPALPIAVAAGAGPDGAELGTDAVAIAAALEELAADPQAGVLVLMDLGSAILSAGMALELVAPEIAARVRLCAAPLVEGAVAAAVSAAAGASLEVVTAEAEAALTPKRDQLGPTEDGAPPAEATSIAKEDTAEDAEVADPLGLHLRPAARIVACAGGFAAQVSLRNLATGAGPASAASLTALTGLGVRAGQRVRVAASGTDAAAAVAAIAGILRAPPGTPADVEVAPSVPVTGRAIPVVPGVAFGPVLRLGTVRPPIARAPVADPGAEAARLRQVVAASAAEIEAEVRAGVGGDILLAHAALLRDPAILERALSLVATQRCPAAAGWNDAIEETARTYDGLADPVLRGRAADVRDAGARVLRGLLGGEAAELPPGPPAVLVAEDLLPSLAARLDPARVLGVIDRRGGPASHAAILLRGAGIPTVMGAAALVPATGGGVAALDGGSGEVWIDPDDATLAQVRQRQASAASVTAGVALVDGVLRLADGRGIEFWANVASQRDAEAAARAGARGIGLLRTEMLFLDRADPPDEAEQAALVAAIMEPFRGRPVVVRTLDAGADKPLPWLGMAPEANPYLGVRGVRLLLARPAVFETQLRALLRAGSGLDLRIMLPMVTCAEEVTAARAALECAHAALVAAGLAHAWPVPLGIMVEVPAAALEAKALAGCADFFSIGTNDLTQYVLAAERGHPALGRFADASHPAVLRLCRDVVEAGCACDRPVSVCGEAAGDPRIAALLVELGVTRLSMSPAAFAVVAGALRN